MNVVRYVAVGPMKGKTFKLPGGLVVKDGLVDVPADLHKSYGHVLKADWGMMPASELPQSEDGDGKDADGDGLADVGPRGGKIEVEVSDQAEARMRGKRR